MKKLSFVAMASLLAFGVSGAVNAITLAEGEQLKNLHREMRDALEGIQAENNEYKKFHEKLVKVAYLVSASAVQCAGGKEDILKGALKNSATPDQNTSNFVQGNAKEFKKLYLESEKDEKQLTNKLKKVTPAFEKNRARYDKLSKEFITASKKFDEILEKANFSTCSSTTLSLHD